MSRTSRRKFAQTLGAAAAVLPLAPLTAQTPATTTPQPSPLANALTEVVRAQSGRFLTTEDVARIASDLRDHMTTIDRLRAFPLTNADEPDFQTRCR